MLKELMIVGALLSPHIVEPSRALIPSNNYQVVNATSKNITLYQAYSDENVTVSPKSIRNYPYGVQTADDWDLYVSKADYPTRPTDFYYIYNAPDYEDPVPITFVADNSEIWIAYIDGYEPSQGIQIGQYESLNNIHAWIDEEKFGINGNLNGVLGFNQLTDLIPSGASFKYVLNNGTVSSTVSHLYVEKTKPSIGSINQVALYANAQQTSIIAYNGYDPNLNPFLLYHGSFTNEIVFQSGFKTVKFGEVYGSLPYFFTDIPTSYVTDNDEVTQTVWDSLTKSFELVGMVFAAIGTPFAWMILPGVSIGVLLLVPLLIGLFVWLIKFLKKG